MGNGNTRLTRLAREALELAAMIEHEGDRATLGLKLRLSEVTGRLDQLAIRNVGLMAPPTCPPHESFASRQARIVAAVDEYVHDEERSLLIIGAHLGQLETPVVAMARWGTESLAETVGISRDRLKGDWFRARRMAP